MTTITTAELERGLGDVLNRVRYQGEQFRIERDGEAVAVLAPAGAPGHFMVGDFITLLERLPRPDDAFADDLAAIHAAQTAVEAPEWPS